MKTLVSISIACCLGLAAAGVAAQDKKAAPMTAADCKTYMDAAAKDAKMKDADEGQAVQSLGGQRKGEEVGRSFPVKRLAVRTASRFRLGQSTFSPALESSCAVSNSGKPITPE